MFYFYWSSHSRSIKVSKLQGPTEAKNFECRLVIDEVAANREPTVLSQAATKLANYRGLLVN
jgi:hypothetical protein